MKISFSVASSSTVPQCSHLAQSVWAYKSDVTLGGCVQFKISFSTLTMTSSVACAANRWLTTSQNELKATCGDIFDVSRRLVRGLTIYQDRLEMMMFKSHVAAPCDTWLPLQVVLNVERKTRIAIWSAA